MPLPSYTFIHRNAKLTTVQKEEVKWIDKVKDSLSTKIKLWLKNKSFSLKTG
jgi:hypothetical protein